MKIQDIQEGKKYWKSKTTQNGRMKTKEVTGVAVYVLDVDRLREQVLASLNGSPAKWFEKSSFSRWTLEDPTSKKLK